MSSSTTTAEPVSRTTAYRLYYIDADILQWTSQSSSVSVRWKAPELLRKTDTSVKYSKESDVYAMACVFYEIFTDTVPFTDIQDEAVAKHVLKGAFPQRPEPSSPSWKARGLNKVVWAFMRRCWNWLPTRRPSSREVMEKFMHSIPDILLDDREATNTLCGNYPAEFRHKMSVVELDRKGLNKILCQLERNPEPEDSDEGDDEDPPPYQKPKRGCIVM